MSEKREDVQSSKDINKTKDTNKGIKVVYAKQKISCEASYMYDI